MNNIYLPELLSLKISNFKLYPGAKEFEYEFVKGPNLIYGGNGMGKTTMVNLIKYGLIGLYKEPFDFTRTYKERKIEKRTPLPLDYFKKRGDQSIDINQPATVDLKFRINDFVFEVTRLLETIELTSFFISENGKLKEIEGEVLRQDKYDQLVYSCQKEQDGNKKVELQNQLENTLQFKYENLVSKHAKIPFDDLIFFVNKILFFGEDHKTILWSEGDDDVQTELFNKYFNDPQLNQERQEANRQAKYFDTQARHRSEDIRVIRGVLEKILEKQKTGTEDEEDSVKERILKIKSQLNNINDQIDDLQKKRKKVEDQLTQDNNRINELSIEVDSLEEKLKLNENKIFEKSWVNLNRNYHAFSQSIITNELCPMCNQELEDKFVQKRVASKDTCLLCEQDIVKSDNKDLDDERANLQESYKKAHNMTHSLQKTMYEDEDHLKSLDKDFKQLNSERRELSSQLRTLEYEDEELDNKELQTIYDEIAELEEAKEENQKKSKQFKDKADEISKKIEGQIADNTGKFSQLFSGFAEMFLGVQCELTFEELGSKQLRFYPVIDHKIRESAEELSESQRFFIDHAFRMSILTFFYTQPSFYIIETPDSSLDISYEQNAANVFLKFLELPYSLIITTNLNNSEFLNYLVERSPTISSISLLEIGQSSEIQNNSSQLQTIYKRFRNLMK